MQQITQQTITSHCCLGRQNSILTAAEIVNAPEAYAAPTGKTVYVGTLYTPSNAAWQRFVVLNYTPVVLGGDSEIPGFETGGESVDKPWSASYERSESLDFSYTVNTDKIQLDTLEKVDGAGIEIAPILDGIPADIDGGSWTITPDGMQSVTTSGHTADDNYHLNGGDGSVTWTVHFSVSKSASQSGSITANSEQDADALSETLDAVEEKFGDLLPKLTWLNFGGGHHITRPGYDIALLEQCIRRAQDRWDVTVYLEPGEACALNAGYLLTHVLDVVKNGDTTIAILDASAACHMPDVIEMPYRPPLLQAGDVGEKACTVRLAGPTCLAGDVIGDYSFDTEPKSGDLLVFGDMAIYTTCKNNTFNGMPLPAIYIRKPDGRTEEIVHFGYRDFKYRLGRM